MNARLCVQVDEVYHRERKHGEESRFHTKQAYFNYYFKEFLI
jgi:hypothetical protein